ncbi:hypothetical protein ABZ379_23380 [Streptomyces canus]|uniref:hypothetical protein n=1 Tax=Streptomyces canus TaxID=58343 RepID=UPI0033F7A11B
MTSREPTARTHRPWPRGVAALLPTPGGLGSLDAALTFALTAAGVPGQTAISAVIGYCLLTGCLPMAPGLLSWGCWPAVRHSEPV